MPCLCFYFAVAPCTFLPNGNSIRSLLPDNREVFIDYIQLCLLSSTVKGET